jgi:hypothetical protein
MPREVTDADGITWSCIQAFAGLGNDPVRAAAARVEGTPDCVHVVCTPDGGALGAHRAARWLGGRTP